MDVRVCDSELFMGSEIEWASSFLCVSNINKEKVLLCMVLKRLREICELVVYWEEKVTIIESLTIMKSPEYIKRMKKLTHVR